MGPTQAAWAGVTVDVPCNAAVLAGDIGGASSGETLNLAAGCKYELTAALPIVSQDLTITGNQATLARSKAPDTPAFTILTVDAGTLTVASLNFTNGNDAIFATGTSSLTVSGGTFTANNAADGGAINADSGVMGLSVTGATFIANSATDAGGAIDTSVAAGSTTVTGDRFSGNTAGNTGGAIYDFNVFGAEISDSRFYANQAANGGAITDNALVGEYLSGIVVSGNSATADGGGVYTIFTDTRIVNSGILGNHAALLGGGLYQFLPFGPGMSLTGTGVYGNSAQDGGGIYSQNDMLTLTGSTIRGNTATADGGGIYNDGSPNGYYTVSMDTSTVSGNQARGHGGGVYNLGELDALGSWINHNTAGSVGGGIYDAPGDDGIDAVRLTGSHVLDNQPDDCEPPGTCEVPGPMASVRPPVPPALGLPAGRWACHPVAGGQYCCAERAGRAAKPPVRTCLVHRRAPMVAAGDHGPLPLTRR